jgi:cardiolipin synthase (CMP-forming)
VSQHEPVVGQPELLSAAARDDDVLSSAILTIPNLVTFSRLACLPVFVWLLLVAENRIAAAFLLGGLGATDWVDGYLARRLRQRSEFGAKFDPTVDRILFIVGLVAIMVDESMPLWFAVAILIREVSVGGTIAVATLWMNMQRFDVTFWGKTATFLLMFAVPGFVLSNSEIVGADGFGYVAWLLGGPGLVLSYLTGVGYIPKIRAGIRANH